MKDVGNITRVMPDKRVEALLQFRKRLADNPKVFILTSFITASSFFSKFID